MASKLQTSIATNRHSEAHIKAAVLRQLRISADIGRKSVIANEFALGRTGVRADLAILGEIFIGIEIKSERDSLRRLPRQLNAYRSHFQRVIVVLAAKHFASASLPAMSGVEVWRFEANGSLTVIADGKRLDSIDPSALQGMLTQAELRRISPGQSMQRVFLEAFRERFGATSVEFWAGIKRRKITEADLAILSRFRGRREEVQRWQAERAEEWQKWEQHALSILPSLAA